jgi:hypothetical protein
MSSNNVITCSSPKQYVMNFNITLANEVDNNTLSGFISYFSSYLYDKMKPFNHLITTDFRFQFILANPTPILVNGQYQYPFILIFTYPALNLTQNAVIPTGGWQFNFYVDNSIGSDVLEPPLTVQTIYLFSDLQTAAEQYNNANSKNIVITNLQPVQHMTWWQSIFNLFFGWIGPVQQWIDTWGLAVLILVLLIFLLVILAIIKFVLS